MYNMAHQSSRLFDSMPRFNLALQQGRPSETHPHSLINTRLNYLAFKAIRNLPKHDQEDTSSPSL